MLDTIILFIGYTVLWILLYFFILFIIASLFYKKDSISLNNKHVVNRHKMTGVYYESKYNTGSR